MTFSHYDNFRLEQAAKADTPDEFLTRDELAKLAMSGDGHYLRTRRIFSDQFEYFMFEPGGPVVRCDLPAAGEFE